MVEKVDRGRWTSEVNPEISSRKTLLLYVGAKGRDSAGIQGCGEEDETKRGVTEEG